MKANRMGMWRRGVVRGTALLALAGAAVAVGSLTSVLHAVVPEPDPVPRRWELELKPGPLRVMTIESSPSSGGGGEAKRYFYLTYKVTNSTNEDVLFAPIFELVSSEGDLVRSGQDVSAEVTKTIVEKLGNPLLMDQVSILGTLAHGEANAREGVVIWPANHKLLDDATVYASGFSGETRTLEVIDPQTKDVKRVLLRKTRVLRYRMPGEITTQGSSPFDLVEDRWVLR